MKLRNKIAAITAAAVLAFTGVGFAAWTFTKSVSTDANVTGVVTAAIEAENVEANPNTFYLICDAPTGQTGLVAGNGIYWSDTEANDGSKLSTITLTGHVNQKNEDKLDFSGYKGKFVITADAVDTKYVDIAAVDKTETVDVATPNGDCVLEYTLPSLTYAKIPSNVDEVTEMQGELAALTIKFTVKFNVESVIA